MTVAWYVQGTGPGPAPQPNESLGIDDAGAFHLWRSVGAPAAGHFAGTLDGPTATRLADATAAASAAGDFAQPSLPGAPRETIELGAARAELNAGTPVDGAWAPLVAQLRGLADGLVSAPAAAIALELDGPHCRLVRVGTDDAEVLVDLASLQLTVTSWEGWYAASTSWSPPAPVMADAGTVTAGPGWRVELPFAHDLPTGPDRTIHVAVDVGLVLASHPIAAGLRHAPVPAAEPPPTH